MKKLYMILHIYDVDGGYGDSVTVEKTLCVTENEQEAQEYVKKYSKPEVYEKPYDELYCHELIIKEIEFKPLDMNTNPFENDWFSESIKDYKEREANGNEDD